MTFEMVKCLQKLDISLSGIRPRKKILFAFTGKPFFTGLYLWYVELFWQRLIVLTRKLGTF